MSRVPAVVARARIAVGAAVILILVSTYLQGVGGQNPFDFFGYFTNLTSLLSAILLIVLGSIGAQKRPAPRWAAAVRGVAVACMLIVSVIYNVLVPGTGAAPPWVSAVLHIVFPAALLLDWICVGDRAPLPWRNLWVVLPYPLVWIAVVLVRGATDGWVPYGFLLPERGGGALVATIAGLLAALLASGALVWLLSRIPLRAERRGRPIVP
ncbi:Pr6Pr family membrane protein [Leucobacter sp. NPDC077196]|uniref:Pr6Pr family membrane protein n=1 Tax=Leucobacter sp. NPDC077196 TaxID=3154959 RepID=UPI0034332DEC